MPGITDLEWLFVVASFLFQIVLIVHFALRKWRFAFAMRYGPIVYALGIPAAAASLLILLGGKPWWLWLSGFLYLVWGIYGYWIEYVRKIEWRSPIRWTVFVPYILLYLATTMFYWFPLIRVYKPLWYIYAALFVITTFLNVSSHQKPVNHKT